ncbi:hypothetical protein PGT21_005391 [Puccinia graminis f. sp. tritici]|uniref:Uncharacterized protein n=1 Tax=Puccinia graminis f. sp. tritici TaxID=56615 RepID=A0A5B0MW73_PUCGR|nr:hypothetical protein PGT21_005391 [Puccinia graminis f. sp. tritici]KAA1120424.1 hypothetical protein PGTUg99_016643 [Puccinia graminis f. sp. tritici]
MSDDQTDTNNFNRHVCGSITGSSGLKKIEDDSDATNTDKEHINYSATNEICSKETSSANKNDISNHSQTSKDVSVPHQHNHCSDEDDSASNQDDSSSNKDHSHCSEHHLASSDDDDPLTTEYYKYSGSDDDDFVQQCDSDSDSNNNSSDSSSTSLGFDNPLRLSIYPRPEGHK